MSENLRHVYWGAGYEIGLRDGAQQVWEAIRATAMGMHRYVWTEDGLAGPPATEAEEPFAVVLFADLQAIIERHAAASEPGEPEGAQGQ